MIKNIISLLTIIALATNLVACSTIKNNDISVPTSSVNASEDFSVTANNDSIIYDGKITDQGVNEVKNLYTPEITKLVITSSDGSMHAGISLGEFVFDNKLDVEVKDYALSAAANYVITAANTLYLSKNSVVGFNGGLSQSSKEDDRLEREFFNKIDVEQQITFLGNKDKFSDKRASSDGFTYTLDSLDKLGVSNIKLIDDSWDTPSNDIFNLFVINRDEFYSTSYLKYETDPENPPIEYTVSIEGNSIVYVGELSGIGLQELKDKYTDNIDRLIINSPGGEINIGMDFGDFIYEKQLDVEVRKLAFSSAANYVITAAKTLYLNEDSVIGWHGGATQEFSSPETEEGGEFYEYNQDSIKRETEFYKKIGVNQKINVYGQEEELLEKAIAIEAFGWTYDIPTLNEFGLDSIESISKPWTPNTTLTFMDQSFTLLLIDSFDENIE